MSATSGTHDSQSMDLLHHAWHCSYEDWALKELIITDA
jgi:hypothetical protein